MNYRLKRKQVKHKQVFPKRTKRINFFECRSEEHTSELQSR